MLRHLALRVMVLMLFVLTQTPILPAAAALALWIDGSHKVEVSAGSDGLTLVLRHQRTFGQNDLSLPQGHQHGLLTRAVLTFAQAASGSHPDHKLSFKNSNESYERCSVFDSNVSKEAPLPIAFTLFETRIVFAHTDRNLVHALSRNEVTHSPGLVGLRTVVMVI